MTTYKFANNAFTLTVNNIQPSDTSVNVTPGSGATFPNISAPGFSFLATLTNPALPLTINEIVLVTARSGDVMTIVRAQESTTAQVWNAGSQFQALTTAGVLTAFAQPGQLQAQTTNFTTDTGAANVYVAAFTPSITTPIRGAPLRILIAHTNTGPSTLDAGSGAQPVILGNGATLSGGEITAGAIEEFTWNGSAWQLGAFSSTGMNYPPSPVPDMQTWMQGHVNAGTFGNWIWGDYVAPAPITVNFTVPISSVGFDFDGANITPGYNNNAVDMMTLITPDSNSVTAYIAGLQLRNLTLTGVFNNVTGKAVRNCLVLSSKLAAKGQMFGIKLDNINTNNAAVNGMLVYGGVFEMYIKGLLSKSNGGSSSGSGVELRQPTFGAGGILSSIRFAGADIRENYYGIISTADTNFQQSAGFEVTDSDFIANQSAGIFAPAGMMYAMKSHFENNCISNGGETTGAIWTTAGGIFIEMCNAAATSTVSTQNYLLDIHPVGQDTVINVCDAQVIDQHTFKFMKIGGTGRIYMDGYTYENYSTEIDGSGPSIRHPTMLP